MPNSKSCVVGFDAFIDYITKPIAGRENNEPRYFRDSGEYADFLRDRKDKSFSVELETPETRIGGNNPNMSRILSGCGARVVSFGAYGREAIEPVFLPLAEQCRLVSFGNPGKCTSYEFAVNKMMNFYNMEKRDYTWENLLKFISAEEIASVMENADIIIFVNLSEQPAVLDIMEMMLKTIFPRFTERKLFFADFSDCTHLSHNELSRSFGFLRALKSFGALTVSVNENEYRVLSRHAGIVAPGLASFRRALEADRLILRTLETFYCSSESGETQVPNEVVSEPRYLTGAGDAQNAGFCLGMLEDMPVREMLLTGVRAGNLYIKTGEVNPDKLFGGASK